MIGVSPAYFFSLHGPGFGPHEITEDVPVLSSMGYEGFQAEIFDAGAGGGWTREAVRKLNGASRSAGMQCTAFVAHFLGSSFASRASLKSFRVDATVQHAIDTAADIDGNGLFALPLPAFTASGSESATAVEAASLFRVALGSLALAVESAGMRLALELTRGNALGGSAAFLGLCREPGFGELGLVFDTGHFWVMGETVGALPELLGGRIVATHLCDNDGLEKLSLCPGDGSVPFDRVIEGFASSGYYGSFDVEIVCPAGRVQAEYTKGFSAMQDIETRVKRASMTAAAHARSTP